MLRIRTSYEKVTIRVNNNIHVSLNVNISEQISSSYLKEYIKIFTINSVSHKSLVKSCKFPGRLIADIPSLWIID